MFSPSTVPISPKPLAWPSKFEARKYLPPNLTAYLEENKELPAARRAVLRVDAVSEIPPPLKYNSMQSSVAKAFDEKSDLMNDFFKNQPQVPQFLNQYQNNGNDHVHSSVSQNSDFYIEKSPNEINLSTIPYVSPNLRFNKKTGSSDEIDVRIDQTPEDDEKQNENRKLSYDIQNRASVDEELKKGDFINSDETEDEYQTNSTKKTSDEISMELPSHFKIQEKDPAKFLNVGGTHNEILHSLYTIDVIPLNSKVDMVGQLWSEKIKALNDFDTQEKSLKLDTKNGETIILSEEKVQRDLLENLKTENYANVENDSTLLDDSIIITTTGSNIIETTTDILTETATESSSFEDRLDLNVIKTLVG